MQFCNPSFHRFTRKDLQASTALARRQRVPAVWKSSEQPCSLLPANRVRFPGQQCSPAPGEEMEAHRRDKALWPWRTPQGPHFQDPSTKQPAHTTRMYAVPTQQLVAYTLNARARTQTPMHVHAYYSNTTVGSTHTFMLNPPVLLMYSPACCIFTSHQHIIWYIY